MKIEKNEREKKMILYLYKCTYIRGVLSFLSHFFSYKIFLLRNNNSTNNHNETV